MSVGVDVGEGRGDAALGHDGVGLAEQRLADEPDRRAARRRLDRRAQPGPAGADDEDVVRVCAPGVGRITGRVDGRVGDDPEREQPDVDVGERHREEARPGPRHVVAVERRSAAARACSGPACRRRAREAVDPAADEVAQRVARQRVAGEQDDVDEEDQRRRGRSASPPSWTQRRSASTHRKNSGMNARYRK